MSFDTQTKLAIYRHFAETGERPSLQVVAERVRADVSSVREAYVRLRAQRVLVLEADGESIRMAPPFSGVPTQHVVIVDETKYFANCAWDSFGIPVALHRPGRVHSRCEQSGEPLSLEIGLEGPPAAGGFFIALFRRPGGGTTLFSRETTCFSSDRKNGFVSGAPRMVIPCGRSSRWTSYGRSRRFGIRRAYKTARGVRSLMRCVPSSPASAWKATFGIRSPTVSVNGLAFSLRPYCFGKCR
jgi:hypothetical protein